MTNSIIYENRVWQRILRRPWVSPPETVAILRGRGESSVVFTRWMSWAFRNNKRADKPDRLLYRRIREDLERYHDIKSNDNRILRICRKKGIKSTILILTMHVPGMHYTVCCRKCSKQRDFTAETPNRKWLMDVTEFKYCTGI